MAFRSAVLRGAGITCRKRKKSARAADSLRGYRPEPQLLPAPIGQKRYALALTHFANPYARFGGSFRKQVLHYKRADGVDLTANLYLPPNHRKTDGPLPTLMEAYPVDFKDKANAGQVSGSPYTSTRISWGPPAPGLSGRAN